jgi:3-hydroxybutyryl-CoA dehydrogenase
MKKEQIGIVGLGLLGRGIAACFLAKGFEVVAVDVNEQQHETALHHIQQSLADLVEKGRLEAEALTTWQNRFQISTEFKLLKDCTFVVESVTESRDTKRDVLAKIEESLVSESAVIASNTSAIPITELQNSLRHADRVVGMHWAEPAHVTRFMELIRGEKTSDEALKQAEGMAHRLGKEPSLVLKDSPGFIVNRIGYAIYREALQIMREGIADADTIDRSLRNTLGLWAGFCGPLGWIDLTGGPKGYARAMRPVMSTLSKEDVLDPYLEDLAVKGARGIINGQGFYQYTADESTSLEESYREHAWKVSQDLDQQFPLPSNKQS